MDVDKFIYLLQPVLVSSIVYDNWLLDSRRNIRDMYDEPDIYSVIFP